jgi:hypothetical protein
VAVENCVAMKRGGYKKSGKGDSGVMEYFGKGIG